MPDVFEDLSDGLPEFPFPLMQVLSGPHENFHYAFADAGEAAVVDPAFHLDRLFSLLAARGLRARTAFFTHGHWDHIGGIPAVADHGVETVVVHEAGAGHSKVAEAEAAGLAVRLVKDQDVVSVGSLPVRVLHTPGHQPESTCFLAGVPGGRQALFTGDTLFIGSCGRTDFPGGDTERMFASMARLRGLVGDVHVMPGHHYAPRPHRPLGAEKVDNPALATLEAEAFRGLACLRG